MRLLKTLVVVLAVLALILAGTFVAARAVLGSDLVRSSLEQQLSTRLGQPVRIESARAAVFPRVALDLGGVSIGEPAAVRVGRLRIVTGLRPLLSRTVSDAEVQIADGRLELPLRFPLAPAAETPGVPSGEPAFRVTSVRSLSGRDIVLAAGSRTLTLQFDSSVEGDRLEIQRLIARVGSTRIEATGELTSISKLEGRLDASADQLDVDELIALSSAFTATESDQRASPVPMHLAVRLRAPAGRFGSHAFSDLSASLDVVPGRLRVAPLAVGAFGGTVEGKLEIDTAGDAPELRLSGSLANLDVVDLLKASGAAGGITGRLGGTLSLAGRGNETASLMRTAHGTIAVSIRDGSMPHMDLVRSVVLAFGKPSGAPPEGSGSTFSRFSGTFNLANGTLSSRDVVMRSRDFDMTGGGTLGIGPGAVNVRGNVVLSEELTAQAGTDLRRYAQEDGRVIVPAIITGTLQRPVISIDVPAAAARALTNELKRRATKLFEGLFKKKE